MCSGGKKVVFCGFACFPYLLDRRAHKRIKKKLLKTTKIIAGGGVVMTSAENLAWEFSPKNVDTWDKIPPEKWSLSRTTDSQFHPHI